MKIPPPGAPPGGTGASLSLVEGTDVEHVGDREPGDELFRRGDVIGPVQQELH